MTRRDSARLVIDGMTIVNDFGLATIMPARIEVLIDVRLKPIKLGSQGYNRVPHAHRLWQAFHVGFATLKQQRHII
ncbi:hypothetical protein [Mesorhizobium sp. M0060]|uniref:hypothetical protein n=1 Tax=Mesorhizobium sp. M0060 TaxID=2956866 RepID=UPI00333532EA